MKQLDENNSQYQNLHYFKISKFNRQFKTPEKSLSPQKDCTEDVHFYCVVVAVVVSYVNPVAEPENAKTRKYQIKILVKKMPNLKNKYQDYFIKYQILKMPN